MSQLSTKLPFDQLLTKWSGTLNPFLSNPLNGVSILKDIQLANGVTVINHLLGKVQQGWFLVDITGGSAGIYRSAAFNDKTLTLTSDAVVTVSLGVY